MSSNNWVIIKLGGTSQCKTGYNNIIKIIQENKENKFIFVLSALSGITNLLEKFTQTKDFELVSKVLEKNREFLNTLQDNGYSNSFYEKFIEDCNQYKNNPDNDIYEQSKIIGYGEVLSTNILYYYLNNFKDIGKIKLLDSYKFIKSKKETFKLYPLTEFYGNLNNFKEEYDDECRIYITQGFIASTPSNKTILLGRGGSDTTGALISNMLYAEKYIVYTDVDGIYTTDPRICQEAKIIKEIDYNIVQELSAMGAKVMHPSSILPCCEKNIPIYIKNTFSNFYDEGTIIKKFSKGEQKVSAIALQKGVKLIRITSENMWNNYGFVYDIFRRFSERRIDVNIISTSQFTISTTCEEKNMILIKDLIQDLEEKYTVELIQDCAIVSIVTNYIPEIYNTLNFFEINHYLLSIGATNNSISFVIDEKDSNEIVNKLHKKIVYL